MSRSEKRARGPFGLGPGLRLGVGFGASLAFACALSVERPPEARDSDPRAETPQAPEDGFAALRITTARIRGLEFLEPVAIHEVARDDVLELVRFELEEAQPASYAEASRDAYAALGVLPVDIDLIDTWLRLHHEQLIGMYSPSRRAMFVVAQPAQPDGYAAEVTVTHEMIHALQHQHFEQTVALLRGLRRNDDVLTGISAAMEGDAFLSMFAGSSGPVFKRSLETAKRLRRGMLVELSDPTGNLALVPRLLRVSLVFPYAHGVVIAARAYGGESCSSWLPVELWAPAWCRGNRGLDRMLESPPLSSGRVLFPDQRVSVEFLDLPLDALSAQLRGRGCTQAFDNVVGSMTLGVLLEDFRAPDAEIEALLPAWRGDRFAYLTCPESREFAWLSRWDTAESAQRFARVYASIAPALAADRLSAPPRVHTAGRSALVLTQGLSAARDRILAGTETRAYASFRDWVEDDCFPESPCPAAADVIARAAVPGISPGDASPE